MVKSNSKWFIIYTKAREEKRAYENLDNQGYETFLPLISYSRDEQSKPPLIEIMFPRYLFIKLDLENLNWSTIKSTRGVSNLVSFGSTPAEVPFYVIESIKSKVDMNDVVNLKIRTKEFIPDDKLIITKGPLKGHEVTFLYRKGKDRVGVLMKLVNQIITAELEAKDLGHKEIREALKL